MPLHASNHTPRRTSHPIGRLVTPTSILALVGLTLCTATPTHAAYGSREPAALPPPTESTTSPDGAGYNAAGDAYPYYGGVADELIPFRNVEPYNRYWTKRLPFRGPGAEYPDPENLTTLKVGLLSPNRRGPEGARGQRTRQGVELAFEEANQNRPANALPFQLVHREDSPQWGSAANIAVEFKDEEVLGFLGTIDGDATHVALRVALKIETYIINTSDPDPTLTETQIPWLTRVLPDERQQCAILADLAVKKYGCQRIAVFRESSRPGRVGVMHFVNFIRRLGFPPVQHLFFLPGQEDISTQLTAIQASNPDAVLFYGQPADIGRFARIFREAGITARFFGFDRLYEPAFQQAAGTAADGFTIPYYFNPNRNDTTWTEFATRYEKRWNEPPDIYAAYGYDGARLMMEAIDKAGPNRFRVRDYLANLDSWQGVTGPMTFDGRWDNTAPMWTARFEEGKWHFMPPANPEEVLSQNQPNPAGP
ncbi:MAG: hypothetical protein RI897_463 [Verrucomicrobiota bacterium]